MMGYQVGEIVAPFTLPRVDGGDFTVDATTAPATVVVFTANHCPYALAWHERIQQVARDYAEQGVQVVQINPNNQVSHPGDSTVASAERVAAGHFAGPYLRDEPQELTRSWGAERTPDVFVVDRAGALVYRGAPDADYEDESQRASYLRAALDEVLAGQPVALAQTPSRGCTIKWRSVDLGTPAAVS
jgi:glutathione peroxidase-family protein